MEKEMVQIQLWSLSDKMNLKDQIDRRVRELGLGDCVEDLENAEFLNLDSGWPVGKDCEITLAQLVVIARKLKMTITITRLSLEPLM